MNAVCFYFEVHQPFRLKPYGFFRIGKDPFYLDDIKNREIFNKVAHKCYLPTTELLLKLVERYDGAFRITFSITGTVIEQMKLWNPRVLENFQRLVASGHVELLAETYHHSLSSLFSFEEFEEQVQLHEQLMLQEFGKKPISFRNTELIYTNEIANHVAKMGYLAMLTEGTDHLLHGANPNFVYSPESAPRLRVLTKNYQLSDDIAFRFSNKAWESYPLTADRFANWLHGHAGNGEVINLFMDFETFGEHQWEDTGIFNFLEALPEHVLQHPDFRFLTVTEAAMATEPKGIVRADRPVSWADMERDVSAWLGNSLQRNAARALYSLEQPIRDSGDLDLLRIFRYLQTSDHLYYMSTKYFTDGDVHKYFSPYESPYDAYVYFMNALKDLRQRVEKSRESYPPEGADHSIIRGKTAK